VTSEHPGRDRYLGQQIVLSIRPEHLSDPTLAPSGSVIKLPIKLRDELGSEVHAHGAIGSAAHIAAGDADDYSLATIVARMDPRTTIAVGETAPVAVEVDQLHFCDPPGRRVDQALGGLRTVRPGFPPGAPILEAAARQRLAAGTDPYFTASSGVRLGRRLRRISAACAVRECLASLDLDGLG
jgi:hypothetical protein